ncbi:hypothetical protein HHK36_014684 [Tetracentron sinense]|uniref:Uncharacterized protein n=1 Tax=Tetracentron sinense TaxID=13715 RepID=A0A835DG16_TETSI|nr:hypothetical protein HHK36_014684 [Tetracentron sinense]
MGEDFVTRDPLDREVDQAIVALKKGAHLLKYGRRGKPKFCPFRLSTDEKLLVWYSGKEEKQLRLNSVTRIISGQRTVNFPRHSQPEKECQSFSLIYANGERSLDLICKDKEQADSWLIGLRALVSRSHHPRPLDILRNRRGAQTCANSPVGYTRRKHNLGLLEDPTDITQVRSLCGSPQSLTERCFSDGLSCSSDSFYSSEPRTLSNRQNVMDVVIPDSPLLEPDEVKKRREIFASTLYRTNMLSPVSSAANGLSSTDNNDILKDVLMWGEGIEGGNLGGGVDRFGTPNGIQRDALLPKLLESTIMLDVHNISLGGKHAALVTRQGEVFCWGKGNGGRLGHKINMDMSQPKIVESLNGVHVEFVACGEYRTCALTLSGELYTWGDSGHGVGIVSDERNGSQWLPHRLSGPLDGIHVSSIACGEWHTAVVSSCGRLFTYGDGTFGVLGHGNLLSVSEPKEVECLKGLKVKCVACGPWHTAAIVEIVVDHFKADFPGGKLFTWGDGDKGRLGHADRERKFLPTCVTRLVDHDFVQVSCGSMVTVGLTNMGAVYTMGSVVHGQLGNPQGEDTSVTIVEGKLKVEFVKQISSGSYHIAVLTSRGDIYSWGKGANGRLGLGDVDDRNSPTLVDALRDRQVESVVCGSSFTAAICLHKSIFGSAQSSCSGCRMVFGFTRKKHNCYNCGLLFCRSCSSKKVMNASLAPNKSKPFRVCDQCFNQLRKIINSDRLLKQEIPSPRQPLTTRKGFTDLTMDRGEATLTRGLLFSPKLSSQDETKYIDKKTMCKQEGNQQPLDPLQPLSGGLPRWGQVPCPALFSNYKENPMMFLPLSKNQLSSLSPVYTQQIPPGSKSIVSAAMSVGKGLSESEKMLTEEVQRLRAEVKCLEKQCQMRSEKLQECQQQIEETWLLAREEAAKSKAAKVVIKAMATKLHTMSEKVLPGCEANAIPVLADEVNTPLPQISPISTDSLALEGADPIFVTSQLPPKVRVRKDRQVNNLCSSPILSCDTSRSTYGRDLCRGDTRSVDDSLGEETDSRKNATKALKHEWVEHDEPGVYITFVTLPCGQKGLKRVRFSRKHFSEKEAERWWQKNQQRVYEKYDIEGCISSNTNKMNN